MSDDTSLTAPATPPPVALLQMMTGYWVSQAIYVAAKLGVADLLADGPVGCEDLAAATNSHAPSLYRVLRALASVGVFTEAAPGTLRAHAAGGPAAHRDARLDARARHHVQRGAVPRLGRPAPQRADRRDRLRPPATGWPSSTTSPSTPRPTGSSTTAMTGWTTQLAGAVVDAYDFSPFGTVVDVGGGYGTLLAAILRRHPGAQGILFDQPHVVAGAEEHAGGGRGRRPLTTRRRRLLRGGAAGADAYMLAQILHDWDDERCDGHPASSAAGRSPTTASCWWSSWSCRRARSPSSGSGSTCTCS